MSRTHLQRCTNWQSLLPDVLLLIFEWCLRFETHMVCFDSPEESYVSDCTWRQNLPFFSPSLAPTNISQVCAYWRAVALSNSKLWSTLYINDIDPLFLDVPGFSRLVEERLISKSGNAPITISAEIGHPSELYVRYRVPCQKTRGHTQDNILDLLQSQQHRLKSMSFLSFLDSPRSAWSLQLRNVPRLEELRLRLPLVKTSEETVASLDLSTCKNLHRIELDGQFNISTDGTILEQLEYVTLAVHPDVFFPCPLSSLKVKPAFCHLPLFLHLTPSLKVLKIQLSDGFFSNEASIRGDEGRITLNSLEELLVLPVQHGLSFSGATNLFDLLTAPALKSLQLPTVYELPDVEEFIRRSCCSIRTASFVGDFDMEHDHEDSDLTFLKWLRCMPDLVSLSIDSFGMTSEWLEGFTIRGGGAADTVLCPRLERLALAFIEPAEDDGCEKFFDMLRSRIYGVGHTKGCLKRLEAVDCYIHEIEGREEVQDWIKNGLKLVLTLRLSGMKKDSNDSSDDSDSEDSTDDAEADA